MKYELAKELKAAGFPQGERGDILIHKKAKQEYGLDERWVPAYVKNTKENGLPNTEWVYLPTLSELIEACNADLIIRKRRDAPCGSDPVDTFTYEACTDSLSYISSTPEEAVARLWLALNEKTP